MTAILQVFGTFLLWLYKICGGSYALALIVFTLLTKVILFPLSYKGKKGMMQMNTMQAEMARLQKQYGNNRVKYNEEVQKLYEREGVNPMSGCLPMLLQWPILFCMFYAMRDIANMELIEQAFAFLKGETPVYESFLWIKNVFMADSPFKTIAPDASAMISIGMNTWDHMLKTVSEADLATMLQHIRAAVPAAAELSASEIFNFTSNAALQTTINTYLLPTMQQMPTYIAQTAAVPGWKNVSVLLFSFTLYTVLPVAISSRILAKIITFASTAIPIDRMIPAIPDRVRVTSKPFSSRTTSRTAA